MILASIADMPRSRSGLINAASPEVGVEVVGHGEDVVGRLTVETLRQDRRRIRASSAPRAGALKYSRTWSRSVGVDVQEQRRLAFGHRLHRRLLEVGGQRRKLAGELQQQLQFVLAADLLEIRHHLGQCALACVMALSPGSSPTATGTRTALPHSVHEPS